MRSAIIAAAAILSVAAACANELEPSDSTTPADFYPASDQLAPMRAPEPANANGCRARGPQGLFPADGAPTGTFEINWHCVSACGQAVPPALTQANRLAVQANGSLAWSRGGTPIATHAATATSNCRRVAADDADGCRAWYDFCGGPNTGVYFMHWFDPATERWQTWDVAARRL